MDNMEEVLEKLNNMLEEELEERERAEEVIEKSEKLKNAATERKNRAQTNVESINVNSLVISGNVKGNLNAAERIEICSGSSVNSDITTARLRISNNVDFNGQVTMIEDEPDIDLFSVASSEYKQALLSKGENLQNY